MRRGSRPKPLTGRRSMALATVQNGGPAPWEPIPGESALWHKRFQEFYLSVGPNRSIDDAWRRFKTSTSSAPNQHQRADGIWKATASKYRWATRAALWD